MKESKKNRETSAEKVKKEMAEQLEGFKAEFRKLPKLKAADFKKETAESLEFICELFHVFIMANAEGARENDRMMADLIGKRFEGVYNEFKAAAEAIGEIYDKLDALEYVLMFSEIRNREHVEGKRMSYEEKKSFASLLSIDFDKMVEEAKEKLNAQGSEPC